MPANDPMIESAMLDAVHTSAGWWRTECPHCEDETGSADKRRSLAMFGGPRNTPEDPPIGYYKCWRCETKGFLADVDELQAADAVERLEKVDEPAPVMQLPDEFIPLSSGAMCVSPAGQYMARRGVGDEAVAEAYVGTALTGFWGGRIIVPLYALELTPHNNAHSDWVLQGFVARDLTGKSPMKYMYPKGMQRGSTLFNLAALDKDTVDPLIVVEGVFDALPHWPNAVACLGKPTMAQHTLLKRTTRPIVVIMDGDAWREGWALAQHFVISGKVAASVRLLAGKDPGDIPREVLWKMATEALDA